MGRPKLEPHIARNRGLNLPTIPLLTPDEEAELEKDLVSEDKFGPIRILPVHRRRD
jgi:hypothetical protein